MKAVDAKEDATHLVEESQLRFAAKVVIGSSVIAVDERLDKIRYTDDLEHSKTVLWFAEENEREENAMSCWPHRTRLVVDKSSSEIEGGPTVL